MIAIILHVILSVPNYLHPIPRFLTFVELDELQTCDIVQILIFQLLSNSLSLSLSLTHTHTHTHAHSCTHVIFTVFRRQNLGQMVSHLFILSFLVCFHLKAADTKRSTEDPGKDPQYAEKAVDSMRAQKDEVCNSKVTWQCSTTLASLFSNLPQSYLNNTYIFRTTKTLFTIKNYL